MLSSQRTTNVLLIAMLVVIGFLVFRFESKTDETERSLNFIEDNTSKTAGEVEYIRKWNY